MKFFLYSHIFLALCAVAMTSDALLLSNVPVLENSYYLVFLFFSTLFIYNIKGLLNIIKPKQGIISSKISWANENRGLFILSYLVSAVALIYLFFYKLSIPIEWILPFVFLSLLYSIKIRIAGFNIEVRRIPFGKTILVAVTWTFVVAFLPLSIAGLELVDIWHVLAGDFLFLLSLSILFDIKDTEMDAAQDLKTLPQVLGYERTKYLSMFLMGARMFVLDYRTGYYQELCITLIALIGIHFFVRKSKEEPFYMFFIDGIMVLKLIVSILFYI